MIEKSVKGISKLISISILALGLMFANLVEAQDRSNPKSTDLEFACGQKLEADVWRLWDTNGLGLATDQWMRKRLVESGDSYALYDFEISFHNLLAMAQRCERVDRQAQLAKVVEIAYGALSASPNGQTGRAWVCRGGSTCNTKNRLLGSEVVLYSAQFLAFATDLANGLNRIGSPELAKEFSQKTGRVAQEHLTRWGNPSALGDLRKKINARPQDIKNGSSALFLADAELWQISIYSNLAGILAAQLSRNGGAGEEALAPMREHLALLLRLLKNRTTSQSKDIEGKNISVAGLDEGFRRLYAENRFAAYSGGQKPIDCSRKESRIGNFSEKSANIEIQKVEPVVNLGLDISHARRLVHLFNAIERNRDALSKVFQIPPSDLPSQALIAAFARQFRVAVWNQDQVKPLFSNYFNGANGWYRVGYDNGANGCAEGSPPFGLSNSFPTGGYVAWSSMEPVLGKIGRQIYKLTYSEDKSDQAFVEKYYSNLQSSKSGDAQVIDKLMFWPSLIAR
ncbi:hypothetical protein ACSFA7_24975 [Variovorax sp. LT1R20]|uniref:hypothetical protein n=1 Tax=Variovorax sp. LT1R20 TaxID=3443729 RepID=UPI003F478D6D